MKKEPGVSFTFFIVTFKEFFVNRIIGKLAEMRNSNRLLEDKVSDLLAKAEMIMANNEQLNKKIFSNTTLLFNSLKKFEIEFSEAAKKLNAANTDIWGEIKGLNLKAELNGK